jgi:hypothetical protein
MKQQNRYYMLILVRDKPVRKSEYFAEKTFSFFLNIQKQNVLNRTTVTKYPYELLLKPADELPEDVNPELREVSKSLFLSLSYLILCFYCLLINVIILLFFIDFRSSSMSHLKINQRYFIILLNHACN